jgi:sugar phosphate isomerase/epimerase
MFTLSAFADEIGPDPEQQIEVLKSCHVHHIELRSVHSTNVLDLTDLQVSELKSLFAKHGVKLSAIGSPIGKVPIDSPFEPHLERFKRAIALAQTFETPNIRIFSYYPPAAGGDWGNWRASPCSTKTSTASTAIPRNASSMS